jgi:hypothetical protein
MFQSRTSDLRSTRPVSPEEAEVIAVAERIKKELSMAIAADRVLRPAASDDQLINCFNVGFAGNAFNLVRHSLLFFQTLALMRLWDTRKDVHSIPRLARLLGGDQLKAKLVARERQATHDTRRGETSVGEGEAKVPFSAGRSNPDQRERELLSNLSSWVGKVNAIRDCAEICRLRNYRHDVLAHSAVRSHRPQMAMPYYGDELKVLDLTIPIVSAGVRLATGIDHDFTTNQSVWDRTQQDMWEIIRSAARGERYSPSPWGSDDLLRELAEKGLTSGTIRG